MLRFTRPLAFLLCLVPALCCAQSVKLPAEVKGAPGAWVVVPAKVDGGKPNWRLPPGLEEVPLDLLFPVEVLDQAKGKIFKSDKPGRYVVMAWNAKGDVASDIAECVVTIGDPPVVVVPPIVPDVTKGPRTLLIVRETADVTPETARLVNALRNGEAAKYLNDNGHKLSILDDDLNSPKSEAWRPLWAGMKLPVLFIIDPRNNTLVAKQELAVGITTADVLAALKKAGG